MKFTKILVPIDGSPHSERAAMYARGLATSEGAAIGLLHCHDRIPALIGGEAREDLEAELTDEDQGVLKPFAIMMRQAGLDPKILIREGHPATIIVETAKEEGYDLIVMGSSGHTGVVGALLGSVAQKVLAEADCPVLVVR
jgi:nucleotide-binding universal stress UspA family protein